MRFQDDRLQLKGSVRRTIGFVTHGGFLSLKHLVRSMPVIAVLTIVVACRNEVINGWPVGHALLEGAVLRRGNVPYDGELFVTCAEHATPFRTTAPGEYRIELSWDFPAGVPADSVVCQVRVGQPSFAATRRVLFVPLDAPITTHTLNVVEP